ncbi:putative transcription initiation factor TFIID, 23-30kDa subunit [Helianthus anomalus]
MSLLFNPVGVFRGKFSSFVYLFVVAFYLFLSFIVYFALDKAHQVFNAMPKRDVFNNVRHDDENTLSEFLASLTDYTPTIPDELAEHYLAKNGFLCPYVRITRLVVVAAQKFVLATDALQ